MNEKCGLVVAKSKSMREMGGSRVWWGGEGSLTSGQGQRSHSFTPSFITLRLGLSVRYSSGVAEFVMVSSPGTPRTFLKPALQIRRVRF